MKRYKRLLEKNIEAKMLMKAFIDEEIEQDEFAYALANDDFLRKVTSTVSKSILNPSPLKSLEIERTNPYVDFGAGLSTFWEEIRKPLGTEVDGMMKVDNVLTTVELGLDKAIPPTTRQTFLTQAGLNDEMIGEFVTYEDFQNYDFIMRENAKAKHMERLNLNDKDMIDAEDERMLEELIEDEMAMETSFQGEPTIHDVHYHPAQTYEEMYGMSAEEIYELNEEIERRDVFKHDVEFPDYINEYSEDQEEFMQESMEAFFKIHTDSIEENQAALDNEMAYLSSLEESMMEREAHMEHPELQLSDDDLRMLYEDNLELNDQDIEDLHEEAPQLKQ